MKNIPEKIQEQFGHMIEAFSYGVPPHGGLAHGIERLLMTIVGEPFLREVVAFPQTSNGTTSVMEAPSEVEKKQMDELIEARKARTLVSTEQKLYEQIVRVSALNTENNMLKEKVAYLEGKIKELVTETIKLRKGSKLI